uniref:Rubicon Homology domain-containing protein n=1 Tax=Meloidogyne enterolobii TaxID=390850 RepID=A0A6V7TM24_MELEN|nr:unnamed protein product [Meloidogyne enterolobii]
MFSSHGHQSSSSRHTNNRLSLSVTPAFPIFISSDIAFIKENTITQSTRTRSNSLLLAEDLSPEVQPKIFDATSDNLVWDNLSLISNESAISAGSGVEKSVERQPIDEQKVCLQLSDYLIESMEELQWKEMTANIDFDEEVDPCLYLKQFNILRSNSISNKSETGSKSSFDYKLEEGRSVFYFENSQEECSQKPGTSRDIELSIFDNTNNLGQPSTSYISPSPKSSNSTRQQKCDEIEERDYSKEEQNLSLSPKINANNLKDLIVALTDSVTLQNSTKLAEIMRRITDAPPPSNIKILNGSSLHKSWRPPRKKFIFDIVKPNDFLTQLALQKHRCAGCGHKFDKLNTRQAQFCHYYSKLFCPCCHQGSKSRLPARILSDWNLKFYPVCDIAFSFITENEDQPVFNVRLINPQLYRNVKNLKRFRKLRVKVAHMWPFVQMCKIAGELLTENGILRTMFTSVPKRFRSLECIDIYSLVDFERIANKNLIEFLEPLAKMGAAHIESCEHCRQQAFFCQICMDPKDLLFPFQLERCYRCDSCGSLSHKKCHRMASKRLSSSSYDPELDIPCEKCERIRQKKLRLQRTTTPTREQK